jgi:hypothetical protein
MYSLVLLEVERLLVCDHVHTIGGDDGNVHLVPGKNIALASACEAILSE